MLLSLVMTNVAICRTCSHILNMGIMIQCVAHSNDDVMIPYSVSLVNDIYTFQYLSEGNKMAVKAYSGVSICCVLYLCQFD